MNNAEIREAIKAAWTSANPGVALTSLEMARLNAAVMDAEKAIKTAREKMPGLSRLEAWSEIRAEFLMAPQNLG